MKIHSRKYFFLKAILPGLFVLTKGCVPYLWFSVSNDPFLYEHDFTLRRRCLNYSFIHIKLKLGVIVGPPIVTQLLEHSQFLTFPTSFHTIFNFLSYKGSSETSHSERQSSGEYHLQLHPHEGLWLIIISMSSNLKHLIIIKTLILILTFNITVRKNKKNNGIIF